MLRSLPFCLAMAALAAGVSAQTQSPAAPATAADKDNTVPLVLNGCVASPEPGTLIVQDEKKGRFELTGHGLDIYIGKRVEVRGRSERGLHITTGLYPSPNGAAQAILDPVRAAQANLPGNPSHATSDAPLPKITVTEVKTKKGSCKPS